MKLMRAKIDSNTLISRDQNPVTADMDGELVMMSITRGNYYGLGEIGSQIWKKLETPQRVDSLCHHLMALYEIDEDTCTKDTIEFLEQLYGEGLIVTSNADDTE
jgi:hypothetical protein